MGATVRVNDRTVVHETSEGVSFAFPDVCLVPMFPFDVPIPFLNVAQSIDAANTSVTVFADGKGVMLKDSFFAKSIGDEPGTGGGVASGTWNGKASFANYSYDVMVEGRNVARLGDMMLQNQGGPPNAFSPAEVQPNKMGRKAWKGLLCAVFCACLALGMRTGCCDRMLATSRWRLGFPCPRRYWDPSMPGLYVEVPFKMSTPPQPYMDSDERSQNPNLRDPNDPDKGMPLPRGDLPPVLGSRRPDVVTVNDPSKPLNAPGNIGDVYDFKFPRDYWRPGQRSAYEKIAGKKGKVVEISDKKCNCKAMTEGAKVALMLLLVLLDYLAGRIPIPAEPNPLPEPGGG